MFSSVTRTRLHLIEASPDARAAQLDTLGDLGDRLLTSSNSLPNSFDGVVIANELLDALPVHQVVMRPDGLHEVYVVERDGHLAATEGPLSDPALRTYFDDIGIMLEDGWRAEVNLSARAWVADAARRLRRGFLILIDYGHAARELYSATHSSGTLSTYHRHVMSGAETVSPLPEWLQRPGEQDITAHVDFTTVQNAAALEGATPLGFLDQTYFLLGLLDGIDLRAGFSPRDGMKRSLMLKTLLMPGGLGSTFKVLILGKGVGAPALKGCSYRMRVT